jgi:hypothetical protein
VNPKGSNFAPRGEVKKVKNCRLIQGFFYSKSDFEAETFRLDEVFDDNTATIVRNEVVPSLQTMSNVPDDLECLCHPIL